MRAERFLATALAFSLTAGGFAIASGQTAKRPLIVPPPGWHAERIGKYGNPAIAIAQWNTFSRGSEEFIKIARHKNFGLNTAGLARYYRQMMAAHGARIYADRPVTICGGAPGWYMKLQDENDTYSEQVLAAGTADLYVVSYVYSAKLTPSPAAEKAIRSLCVPGNGTAAAPLPVRFTPPSTWVSINASELPLPASGKPLAFYAELSGGRGRQNIYLLERNGGPGQAAEGSAPREAHAASRAAVSGFKQTTIQMIKLCGKYDGLFIESSGSYNGIPVTLEETVLLGGTEYDAIYSRPSSLPEAAAARTALMTLCPRE